MNMKISKQTTKQMKTKMINLSEYPKMAHKSNPLTGQLIERFTIQIQETIKNYTEIKKA